MEKQLKDYLHLYLGCDAVIGYNPESKAGILIDKIVGVYEVGATVSNGYIEDFKNIKPILRPLSSITEDEKKELWHLDDHALHELGDGSGYALPYVFTWCLSKHFDLFGLIDAGLAIDKSTLLNPAQ